MKRTILLLLFLSGILTHVVAQETITQYLSGTDKDHTVPWEFFCTKGRNSGKWTTIPVPSLWDQQGFGNSLSLDKSEEQGLYRYSFPSPKEWQSKKIVIVFDGVLSNAVIKLNGKPATEVHQSGLYQFNADLSSLIRFDEPNMLEVVVTNPASANVDKDYDFTGSGGIFGAVYLKVMPEVHIERVAIDAKANGNFTMRLTTQNTKPSHSVEVQIQDLKGAPAGPALTVNAGNNVELKKAMTTVKAWNPESPNLYEAVISIKDNGTTLHTITQRFGFRTSELKEGEGFYINGAKILFKGINRRGGESGLTPDKRTYIDDINMYKDMNMNAVRLSNFPPDPEFLNLCDSLGLFVINELSASSMSSDTAIGRKIVRELVLRDVNHPSIVMWSSGNDKAYKDSDYSRNDLQQRYIIRPVAKFGEPDVKKNADFSTVANSILFGTEASYPSEFSHGVYSGGHAAGLESFWTDMLKSPKFSGGFLWSYRDESSASGTGLDSIRVSDPTGKYSLEKGPSYYAIREIWSPLAFEGNNITTSFNGELNVQNKFFYTNLNSCRFDWKFLMYPKATMKTLVPVVVGEGTIQVPDIGPGQKGQLKLDLPATLNTTDALVVTAYDSQGREIGSWSWAVRRPVEIVKTIPEVASISTIMTQEDADYMSIIVDGINYIFSKKSGNLSKVYCGKRDIPLIGPFLTGADSKLTEFKHYEKEKIHFIEAAYLGDNWLWCKWTFQTGELPKLEYQYAVKAAKDYAGISFSFPEEKVLGIKWMGRGPFNVWRNRLKGLPLGVWEKNRANAAVVAGEVFRNGDVKGWHSDLYWAQFQTTLGSFTIYNETPNLFLQFYKPQRIISAANDFANPAFPEIGGIGFMHNISGIGTKPIEKPATPPPSSKSSVKGDETLSGALWIDFRY